MKRILVIGSRGQLGRSIRKISRDFPDYTFHFTDSLSLDIRREEDVLSYFWKKKPDYCINAAAYTDVDKAENNEEIAFDINAYGAENVARACDWQGTTLFHISTDYVFNGKTSLAYQEDDFTDPLGTYGRSKEKGESLALLSNPKTIVIRTSWLYSEFGQNFVKTISSLLREKKELSIVSDQYGQPTNAHDLSAAMMKMIGTEEKSYGIFHFSNASETTWFDFAKKIAKLLGSKANVLPISRDQYPGLAKRPVRSTLCLDKIRERYGIEIEHWEDALEKHIRSL